MTNSSAVEVVYYTDPLCSWSWALEAPWRRLRYEFAGALSWRMVMGGMIADWERFHDPLQSVHVPGQMGPAWYHVRQLSGMPIDERIWVEDPPTSSYPACIAVKAAGLQGTAAEERYLRRLREAVMLQRRNIARREVLLELAKELEAAPSPSHFNAERFETDLDAEEALSAFRDDLKEVRYRGIGRFPTLVFRRPDGAGLMTVGYRPYAALRAILRQVAPDLVPTWTSPSTEKYANYWESITERELVELDVTSDEEITGNRVTG